MPARALTPEEQKVVWSAYERGVSSCMSTAGFTWSRDASNYEPPKPDPFPPIDELRRSGYGADFEVMLKAQEESGAAAENDPIGAVPEPQRSAYLSEFNTCDEQVINAIYGSQENVQWLSDTNEVGTPFDLSSKQQENPEYTAAMKAWQQCMRDRGVTWMGGQGAWEGWDSGYWALDSKALEDDIAPPADVQNKITNDDADCQGETGLDKIRATILPGIKDKLWEGKKFNEADKWRYQQWVLANAKKIP